VEFGTHARDLDRPFGFFSVDTLFVQYDSAAGTVPGVARMVLGWLPPSSRVGGKAIVELQSDPLCIIYEKAFSNV